MLIRNHNLCFNEEIRKYILSLSSKPILNGKSGLPFKYIFFEKKKKKSLCKILNLEYFLCSAFSEIKFPELEEFLQKYQVSI